MGSGTGNYNNISFETILGRNSTSQPIYPRNGSEISVGLEVTPPYSLFSDRDYSDLTDDERYKWIEYYKVKLKAYWYFEFVDKLVLAAKFRFGFLGHYNSELGTTPFERFYLGGSGLSGYALDGREVIALRGYDDNSLTPKNNLGSYVGGTIYNKYTVELRYPISLNPMATIYVLGFVEAGNAWTKFNEFNPFDVKRSAGVGVRIFLPMFGLLGLDWGYGFDNIPGTSIPSKGQIHFIIGQFMD